MKDIHKCINEEDRMDHTTTSTETPNPCDTEKCGTADSELTLSDSVRKGEREDEANRKPDAVGKEPTSVARQNIIAHVHEALDDEAVVRWGMNCKMGQVLAPSIHSAGSVTPDIREVPCPTYPLHKLLVRPVSRASSSHPNGWQAGLRPYTAEPLERPPSVSVVDLSVESNQYYLDIVEEFRNNEVSELSERLSFSRSVLMCSSPEWRYKAIVRGKIPLPGFVLDDDLKIWHLFGTSRFVVVYNDPFKNIACQSKLSSNSHEKRWSQLLVLILNTMFRSSTGAHNPTSDLSYSVSPRSIIVLQTIREMLHWRHIMLATLTEIPPHTTCTIENIGRFSVTAQARLSFEGYIAADSGWLDPTIWKDPTDYAGGLLAWVNTSLPVVNDPAQLLQSIDVTTCSAAHWAMVSLQFGAQRNLDQALAFVGLIRFLVMRHYIPTAGHPSLFCVNEFIDRAVAIPELEGSLPEVLNLQDSYERGYEIDTGAVTAVEVLERRKSGSASKSDTRRNSPCLEPFRPAASPVAAGIGLRGLRYATNRRVVMSVWTSPLTGIEWTIPQTVRSSIDFKVEGVKYQLSVTNGHVTCARIGFVKKLKDHFRSITQIQTPFLGIQREYGGCTIPEAGGAVAISNALALAYGEDACRQMLSWLHRGVVNISPNCTAASFVPCSSHRSDMVVNQQLCFTISRQMVFGRYGHALYWLPGEGIPCFRVQDCPNGTFQVTEVDGLPPGVELCRAELTKVFG